MLWIGHQTSALLVTSRQMAECIAQSLAVFRITRLLRRVLVLRHLLQHHQAVLFHGHRGLLPRDSTLNQHTTSTKHSHTAQLHRHDPPPSINHRGHDHPQYHTPGQSWLHRVPNQVSSPCNRRYRPQNPHNSPMSRGKRWGRMLFPSINHDTTDDNPPIKQRAQPSSFYTHHYTTTQF